MFRSRSSSGYNRARLTTIVFVIVVNLCFALVSVTRHRYPLGLAPVLLLIPGLLRELDLRRSRPMRRFGPFEWSCLFAGLLFLAILPFVIR